MRSVLSIENKETLISGRVLKTARLHGEYYDTVENPEAFVDQVRKLRPKADLFTFVQSVADRTPKHSFKMEWDEIAVLPITDYQKWWKTQIKDKTRNMVRRAQKGGVELRIVKYDDELVRGISSIYNENPFRQGKRFKHFGKDFEAVKRENGTYVDRTDFVGAYLGEELIGFIKLVHGNGSSNLMQILSKISHRDKAPTNALLAKAVEICAAKNIPHLHYGVWSRRGIGEFKKNNGFMLFQIPRYYIPLTLKGRLALSTNLHRNLLYYVPEKFQDTFASIRSRYFVFKTRNAG